MNGTDGVEAAGTRPPPRAIRAVVVDDDAFARRLMVTIVSAAGVDVVGQATDGDEVVAVVQAHRPDLVLMDIRMDRMDGIAATRAVRALPSPPHVLALTSFDTESAIVDAIDAGAAGFFAKDAASEEIVAAVRNVVRGEGALSPRAARVMVERVRASGQDGERQHAQRLLATLTERELDVAEAIAQGLSNEEIAAQLHLSVATVKTYQSQANAKLGVDNRVKLARVVMAAGRAPLER